jgi:hypothetical protein
MQKFRLHYRDYNYLQLIIGTLLHRAKRIPWKADIRLNPDSKTIDIECSFDTMDRIESFLDMIMSEEYQIETVD